MIKIQDLLERFQNLLLTEEKQIIKIQEIIQNTTNIEIPTQNISISNGVILLKTKPIYKNEILLKKELILNTLKSTLGKKTLQDIR